MSNIIRDWKERNQLITIDELSELLSIHKRTLFRMKSANELPTPLYFKSCLRWRKADIEDWIEEKANAAQIN